MVAAVLSKGFLEFHHVTPYASGGSPTADNIELRCRAHNGYEAEIDFGTQIPSIVREPTSDPFGFRQGSRLVRLGCRSGSNSVRTEYERGRDAVPRKTCAARRVPMRPVVAMVILGLVLGSFPALSAAQPVWIDVEGAEGSRLRAAVLRPQGEGPFPLVLWLHASPGLDDDQLRWASDIATAGYVAMAGCYFGKGSLTVSGRDPCPDAHPINGEKQQAIKNVLALVAAGKALTGVRRDRVGLVGVSWGGNVAVLAASGAAEVQAVVSFAGSLNRPASPNDGSALGAVERLSAPLLIIQGGRDETVPPHVARQYEEAARAARKISRRTTLRMRGMSSF